MGDGARIAIVNRGDAAVRLIQAVRELNFERGTALRTIVLYTEPDRDSAFVREADEAVLLGPATTVEAATGQRIHSYLDLDRLARCLREARADMAWVGWGFVSERATFAELCRDLGVTFIGPSPEVISRLGDKVQAKRLAEAAGVPPVPWSGGPVRDLDGALRQAAALGYPVMVKAAAGGGGRGIRHVASKDELAGKLESAAYEAHTAFGDSTLFLEKAVGAARHIEVQVVADLQGTVWALGVRDCTVQLRRQKIIEESGAHGLDDAAVDRIRDAAARVTRAAGYTGVGTVEFLLDTAGVLHFMEVNTRLQVEHTVTEATTGVDLVKLQLDIARGVPLQGSPPPERGHAVEARITALDVADRFRPAPGRIVTFRAATGPGIRTDSGIAEGDLVPQEFDPLLVKLIAHGRDRPEAFARLARAVEDTRVAVEGGATTSGFVRWLLRQERLRAGDVHVGWVDELVASGVPLADDASDVALVLAAVQLAETERLADRAHLLSTAARGRPEMAGAAGCRVELTHRTVSYSFTVHRTGEDVHLVEAPDGQVPVEIHSRGAGEHVVSVGPRRVHAALRTAGPAIEVDLGGTTYRTQSEQAGVLRAPSPSIVVQVRAAPGQEVAEGDVLIVLESMKMENTLVATSAGVVREVFVEPNHQVDAGDALLHVEPLADTPVGGARTVRVDFSRLSAAVERPDALEMAGRRLLGFAAGPASTPAGSDDEGVLEQEVTLARLFADCCSMATRRGAADAVAPTRGISAQEWLFTFLRAPERSRDVLPAAFLDELAATLRTYGAPALDPGEQLDEALYRLCCAQQAVPEVEPLVVRILRRWLRDAPAGGGAGGDDLLPLLERLSEACETSFPAVSDSAQAVAHELYVRPALAARSRPEVSRGEIDLETAERLELWRLREFAVEHVTSTGDLHLFYGVAHSNAEDRRLFVIGGVSQVEPLETGHDEPAAVAELEHALVESLAMIRMHQAAIPPARRALFNRIVLYVDSPWEVTSATLHHLAHRLARPTRNLGIEKVLARVRVAGPDGVPVDRLLHMTAPATTGVALGETAPSAEPVRPLSRRQQRILRLRRRGLRDPFDIADLLVARDAQRSDFPPGQFHELDLDDAGELVEVSRPYGENTAAIVAGIAENYTEKHPEGIRRVVLLSDPSHGLGALAEPECRRIIAAIALAERLEVPIEWFTVSSGARISMSSGTENMDWVARVLRRIVGFTQSGGEINIIVSGVSVGAQPYFNAEATMLMHTRGILIMTPSSSMLLTGKEALDFAGGVSAEDNLGIGGYDRVMGPNGQAQYWAPTLEAACETLFRHYDHTYVVSGERFPRRRFTVDPADRDVRTSPHPSVDSAEFRTVGDIFSAALNQERKKPFDMRAVMGAVVDADSDPLERWSAMAGAEVAIVWDAHLGGVPVCLIGIESHPLPRVGIIPADGPDSWSAATLFPRASKKVARALNAASGNRCAVILANLAGFDGSPESLRELQLEYGAEIGRAITNFSGPLILCVVSRYHGGAFVVFSKALNDRLQVLAVEGARASVIGGSAAAAVVFGRDVEARVLADARVAAIEQAWNGADEHGRLRLDSEREDLLQRVRAEVRGEVAREFDAIHTIERAQRVGSVDRVIAAQDLRPELIAAVERGIEREGDVRAAAIDR